MSSSWIRQLEQDGFAFVRNGANAETVAALRAAFKGSNSDHAVRRDGAVYATRGALELAAVREWALSDSALEIARRTLGPAARPVRGILFDKRPEANWPVAWHQDVTIAVRERRDINEYGPWSIKAGIPHVQPPAHVLEHMVTLRLHLDACPASNGALEVIPGSHQRGKLSHAEIRETAASSEPITCEAAIGDILLMRPLLLHRSSPSESPRNRRVVHVEYATSVLDADLEWATALELVTSAYADASA